MPLLLLSNLNPPTAGLQVGFLILPRRDEKGAGVNDVPVARQSRDPARPQAGESLLDAKHECSPAKPNAARWKMQPEVARTATR